MATFIPWSGGYDSTLLLYETAKKNPTQQINALTILNVFNTKEQSRAELKARNQLKKKFKLNNIKYHIIDIRYTNTNDTFQMTRWLSTIIPVLSDGDTLSLSYLSSDGADFFMLKPEFEKAFHACMKLREISCTLEFPLMYKTKGYVIKELKKAKLLPYVWACGQPNKGKPCGICMKCISIKRWTTYPDRGVDT